MESNRYSSYFEVMQVQAGVVLDYHHCHCHLAWCQICALLTSIGDLICTFLVLVDFTGPKVLDVEMVAVQATISLHEDYIKKYKKKKEKKNAFLKYCAVVYTMIHVKVKGVEASKIQRD